MPITIAQLKGNLRTINVPYFDDNITVTYRPGELTPASASQINQDIEGGGGDNAALQMLCRCMASWDVMEEKDKMLPITEENLAKMPGPLLLAIQAAIGEDGSPKPKSARGSFAR